MSATVILEVVIIIFIAALTRSTLGFGDALIGMPLMTLVIDIQVAAALSLIVSMMIASVILYQNWAGVDMRAAGRLIVAAFAGVPTGILILKRAPEPVVTLVLGIVLVIYGTYSLLPSQATAGEKNAAYPDNLAYAFGFVSGLLGGAYNTSGPPVVVYGTMRKWPPDTFRTTLQSFFLPTGVFTMLAHALGGLWTGTVLSLVAYSLPVVVLSIFLGGYLSSRIPHQAFSQVIHASLVMMGIMMVIRIL